MSVVIDKAQFWGRLKLLYALWEERPAAFGSASALAVANGNPKDQEQIRYLKSVSLQLWLYGYELPDTIMVFTKKKAMILTSTKKAKILAPLVEGALEAAGVEVELLGKEKSEDGSAQIETALAAVREAAGEGGGPTLATLPKDKHEGKVHAQWIKQLGEATDITQVDMAPGVSSLLASKSKGEVLLSKKAAYLASAVLQNHVVPKIEEYWDQDKKVRHSELSDMAETAIENPRSAGIKLLADNTDVAYSPVFQSGGTYDLRVGAGSNSEVLHAGVVLVSLGAKYSQYCANLARTLLVNPTKEQEANYAALHAAHSAAVAALVDGAALSSAYDAVIKSLESQGKADLIPHLTRNVGHGMGLEFRDSLLALNGKNENVAKAGMVFNISVGLQNLSNEESSSKRSKVYALSIADTVLVMPDGDKPDVLTGVCKSDLDSVSYNFEEEEEDEDAAALQAEADDLALDAGENGVVRRNYLRGQAVDLSEEAERQKKQKHMLERKNQETLERLTRQQDALTNPASHSGQRQVSNITSYKNTSDVQARTDLVIQVDAARESVLCPIYGLMVPFHILTVKSIAVSAEDDRSHRINLKLNHTGAYDPAEKFPDKCFIKELSYRTPSQKHAVGVVQQVQMLRKQVMQRDKENAERATLVRQEKLRFGKRVYRLQDVWVRPTFGGKGRKVPGMLECHANGFRYSSNRGEALDVMFGNIRHAFFQPCENEMVTLVHFNLLNPIMVGKKKTVDVQFYRETMDAINTLDGGSRRNAYDPDEIEEEQRERERRNKINAEFQQFTKRCKELFDRDFPKLHLDFEVPFRELAFSGVPHRTASLLMPTTSCIVELVEQPTTCITMSDIEIVSLERVGFGLKNFDMAIVWKDFAKDVQRIDAIPAASVDEIKQWLTDAGIKYYESKMNLQWRPILKNIIADPHGFVEQGGWDFLDAEGGSDDEESEEEEPDFRPSEDEGEGDDESEDISSEDESVVDSEDESEDGDVDSDEEEGLSWDELEAQAKRADKERDEQDSDDDDRDRGKKRKGGGGPPPSKRRR